jgi:hypothetical protein
MWKFVAQKSQYSARGPFRVTNLFLIFSHSTFDGFPLISSNMTGDVVCGTEVANSRIKVALFDPKDLLYSL